MRSLAAFACHIKPATAVPTAGPPIKAASEALMRRILASRRTVAGRQQLACCLKQHPYTRFVRYMSVACEPLAPSMRKDLVAELMNRLEYLHHCRWSPRA
jgi:ketopantoate reductase